MQTAEETLGDHEIVFRRLHHSRGRYAIPIDCYPSGEPLVRWADVATERDYMGNIDPMGRLLVRQQNMGAFMTAMFLVDALSGRGHPVPELVLPFVPGARQDRLNPVGDFLFTIKSVAKLINERNFPRVTVIDPHSDVTPALIDRCHVISAADCLSPTLAYLPSGVETYLPSGVETWDAVVSPDAGSEKRAGLVAGILGVPVFHGWKNRDVATGQLTGFGLQEIPAEYKNRPLLVVDDICDGGGTFIGLAAEIAKQGCTADLFVTHGIFAKGTKDLLSHYRKIFCTDTIIANRPGVNVFNMCAGLI